MVSSHQISDVQRYSSFLAQKKDILQIAGGVPVTLIPETILAISTIHGVCVGEGEKPLKELLQRIAQKKSLLDTQSFYWNTAQKTIKKNPLLPFTRDLSSLDFPDYSVYESNLVVIGGSSAVIVALIARGCPYNCTFCANPALKKFYNSSSPYFRLPTVDYAIALLKNLLLLYPHAKQIHFHDDLLVVNKPWFIAFSKRLKNEIGLPYRTSARVENIDEELTRVLAQTGCQKLYFGLESGNQSLRFRLLNKRYTNKEFIRNAKLLRKYGILVSTYNVIGFPFETPKQMRETFLLNKKIKATAGTCSFFTPYEGTALRTFCEKHDLLLPDEQLHSTRNYFEEPLIKMSKKNRQAAIYYQYKINYYLKFRENLFYYTRRKLLLQPFYEFFSKIIWPVRWQLHLLHTKKFDSTKIFR